MAGLELGGSPALADGRLYATTEPTVFAEVTPGRGAPCRAEIEVRSGPTSWLDALRADAFFAPHFAEP